MPDVGDTATLALSVSPFNVSTTATVAITSPTGATSTLTAVTADGGATWNAYLPLTVPGAWQVLWTVTGQGAGVQPDTVYAFGPILGRSYATLSDLAGYLGTIPPDGAGQFLVRATRLVDMMLVGAWYAVDDTTDLPTYPAIIAALRDATCAQAEWMDTTGDAVGAAGLYDSASIGNVSFSRKTGSGSSATTLRYAPDAANILRLAGLLPVWAQVPG